MLSIQNILKHRGNLSELDILKVVGFVVEYLRCEIMIFTEEDIKRIAKNIKTIRLAYGYKTQLDFALALDPNARYPGLSHDMIKKYESGKYPITEQAVRLISSLTLCSFEDIVFENLNDLEPNSLVLNSDEIEELNNDKDLLKEIGNDLSNIFPLFEEISLIIFLFFTFSLLLKSFESTTFKILLCVKILKGISVFISLLSKSSII